ncbi:hypothetical protein TNIN_94781 [Trichonephila inaurata madagascariensis]|uniref:Uncharacterized protein n=1 Tax=Trichonephila inaurata madagascariensis TaxID=2747483 RepID=A0A8X6JRZ7_9ARAC|nr:hypothetical protein TNIN_94781 [Trichonephila inaurata madagascariensis]
MVRGTAKEEQRNSDNQKSNFRKGKQALTTYVQETVTKEAGSRSLEESGEPGPEENDLRNPARKTRVDTTGSSPNTRVPSTRAGSFGNGRSSRQSPRQSDTPDSKIARRRTEGQE